MDHFEHLNLAAAMPTLSEYSTRAPIHLRRPRTSRDVRDTLAEHGCPVEVSKRGPEYVLTWQNGRTTRTGVRRLDDMTLSEWVTFATNAVSRCIERSLAACA